jgi:hypothetical protein
MRAVARFLRLTHVFLMLAVIFYALPAQAGPSAIIVFDPPGSTSTSPAAVKRRVAIDKDASTQQLMHMERAAP